MNRKWEALLAVAGLGLFAFSVSKIGWSAVVHAFEQASVAILVIAVLSLMRMLLQTVSWTADLRHAVRAYQTVARLCRSVAASPAGTGAAFSSVSALMTEPLRERPP
jgi:hypothetical protein